MSPQNKRIEFPGFLQKLGKPCFSRKSGIYHAVKIEVESKSNTDKNIVNSCDSVGITKGIGILRHNALLGDESDGA
jgi:hypothetical protein